MFIWSFSPPKLHWRHRFGTTLVLPIMHQSKSSFRQSLPRHHTQKWLVLLFGCWITVPLCMSYIIYLLRGFALLCRVCTNYHIQKAQIKKCRFLITCYNGSIIAYTWKSYKLIKDIMLTVCWGNLEPSVLPENINMWAGVRTECEPTTLWLTANPIYLPNLNKPFICYMNKQKLWFRIKLKMLSHAQCYFWNFQIPQIFPFNLALFATSRCCISRVDMSK